MLTCIGIVCVSVDIIIAKFQKLTKILKKPKKEKNVQSKAYEEGDTKIEAISGTGIQTK